MRGRVMKLLVVFLVAMLCGATVQAESYNGNHLYSGLQIAEVASTPNDQREAYQLTRGFALGFVLGVAEAGNKVLFCMPEQGVIVVQQIQDVVRAYLRDHPADRHESASDLTVRALKAVYPCPVQKLK
jgi:Rap1a immunity proteins